MTTDDFSYIEPQAHELLVKCINNKIPVSGDTLSNVSTAVSLKRIAESLEEIRDEMIKARLRKEYEGRDRK